MLSHFSLSLRKTCVYLLSICLSLTPLFPLTSTEAGTNKVKPGKTKATTKITSSAQGIAPHKTGEVLIKFRENASEAIREQILSTYAKSHKKLRGKDRVTGSQKEIAKLKIKDNLTPVNAANELKQLDAVIEWAEPNFLVSRHSLQTTTVPNDQQFSNQWSLKNTGQNGGTQGADINAVAGWAKTTGAKSTIIAIIDTGVDTNHADLKDNLWINQAENTGNAGADDDNNGYDDDKQGWNFVADNNNVSDDHGHGTQLAGIIAAEGNNSLGISGVMWKASVLPLKALDATGTGTISDVVEAMDYAVAKGVSVINCSFGTSGYSQALLDAINRAAAAGVLVVASAGNNTQDNSQSPYYPASYTTSNLISIAASTSIDTLADFSNWGSNVHAAAPGVDILTTKRNGGYELVSGTSASGAIASGLAGLLKTLRPWISAFQVRRSLISGVRQVAALNNKVSSSGVLDAAKAIEVFLSAQELPTLAGNNSGNGGSAFNPSGGANLDSTRNFRPSAPEPTVKINSLPPNGYSDPKPTNSSAFNTYYTEQTKSANDTGTAGAKPLQAPDPTASNTPTGGYSINLQTANINFTAPVVSLAGRAGLDLSLNLIHNSLIWTKDPNSNTYFFNSDKGFPGPGWRIGYGAIQGIASGSNVAPYTNSVTGKQSYLLIQADGTRRDLALNSTTGKYESYDSSYLDFDANTRVLRSPSGLQVTFATLSLANGDAQMLPTEIKDRNGNFITIVYKTLSNNDVVIDYITDTLSRRIDFYYQSNRLTQIKQDRNGTPFIFAEIDYEPVTINTNFSSMDPVSIQGAQVYLPSRITYPTGLNLRFFYTSYAQIYLVEKWVPTVSGQGSARRVAYTYFNLKTTSGASYPANSMVNYYSLQPISYPNFTVRADQAENWQSGNTQIFSYNLDPYWGYVGVKEPYPGYREYRFTTSGLVQTVSFLAPDGSGGTQTLKQIQLTHTKDTGLSYNSNLRVT